jgi:large subunit ribosomal protein L35
MKLKLKTSKAAAKRFSVKKNCISRKKAYKSHLLRRKNSKRLRTLSLPSQVHKSDTNKVHLMLPYN